MDLSMNLSQGQRVKVRGEDFLVTKVNYSNKEKSKYIFEALGLKNLVKGRSFIFDTTIDSDFQYSDPSKIDFQEDKSVHCINTKLYIETLIRKAPVHTGDGIAIATKGVFRKETYQFVPTIKAFNLPRPRLLIADAVGLGKTIEVGIFLSEMIKKGKGKRIMVLALKSILTQFQQEIWSRFAIPLVRLDSIGIQKLRSELPINKNPFDYYDKTIISIDTLKQNEKFQHYIEKTRWDIIVIDECHTVANRLSERGDLAKSLSKKCESLILTSATPHSGKKENFANIIGMIEPTAISWNGDFDKEDIKKYFVRRFKKDIQSQLKENFLKREIVPLWAPLSLDEINFLELQQEIKNKGHKLNAKTKDEKDLLFSIGLFKSFLSSPQAALETILKRINKVKEKSEKSRFLRDDIVTLNQCKILLEKILSNNSDTKYEKFKSILNQLSWSGKKDDKRFVVFAERIGTLKYLEQRLIADFKLSTESITIFSGQLSDKEQQEVIEDFGKQDSPTRILLCSDAGSLGVNLHYYCHIIFNYDIPWSLITLEQRNGRIDRYGQKENPRIYYLLSKSENSKIESDLRIIDKLREKEQEVYQALGDAESVFKLYDSKKEEAFVIDAIKSNNKNFTDIEKNNQNDDFFEELFSDIDHSEEYIQPKFEEMISLFDSDSKFYESLCNYINHHERLSSDYLKYDTENNILTVANTTEIQKILYDIPIEAKPKLENSYFLTLDKELVEKSISNARKKKGDWPKYHILYENHPLIQYLLTIVEANSSENQANIVRLNCLPKESIYYIVNGQVANASGAIILSEFFTVFHDLSGNFSINSLQRFVNDFELQNDIYSLEIKDSEIKTIRQLLPQVIVKATEYIEIKKSDNEDELFDQLIPYDEKLNKWKSDSYQYLNDHYRNKIMDELSEGRKKKKIDEIESLASITEENYNKLKEIDNRPYIKVLAVFFNS